MLDEEIHEVEDDPEDPRAMFSPTHFHNLAELLRRLRGSPADEDHRDMAIRWCDYMEDAVAACGQNKMFKPLQGGK
eukprot:4100144-Lingulodinium_polyedra.AAC.1